MKIDKAIEIVTKVVATYPSDTHSVVQKAHQLSIEALKRTSQRRENLSWKFEPLLPGETV